MKKISVVLLSLFAFLVISCENEPIDPALQVNNGSSNNVNAAIYKWRFKLDGVLYEWEGNHIINPNSGGQSTYSINSIALQKTNSNNFPILTVSMIFPSTSTGNFVFNSSNSSTTNAFQITFINSNSSIDNLYSTTSGGTMNVNISSLSNVTLYSNPTNPGKVIGTFSGTIKSALGGSNIATITDGSFEAIRGQ
jgi:hypothetical protein